MYDNHKTGYQELQSRDRAKGKPPRQQVQCSFRLINVLFSDNFAGDLVTNLGNVASSKHHLDTDTVVNEEHFWLQVRAAFIVPNPEYDSIRFAEDIVFLQEPPIDPSNIVPHDWQKLRSIWKDLISEYMAAMTRFTQSRTQRDMNFYNFCNGKADVYYLKKNLEQRPGLNYMLEADQSEEESSLSSDMIGNRKSPRSTNSSKRKWCEDESEHEIADAIRDFSNSARLSELAKLKIYFMEKEDRRRQHQFAFDEWGNIQTLLRSLREDVKNCVDDVIKAELEDDIKGLVQRKKKLSTELGFH